MKAATGEVNHQVPLWAQLRIANGYADERERALLMEALYGESPTPGHAIVDQCVDECRAGCQDDGACDSNIA